MLNLHERCEIKQNTGYASLKEVVPLALRGKLGLYKRRLVVKKSIHNTICKVIAQFGADSLATSQAVQIPVCVQVATFRTFRGREKIRKENYIILRVPCVRPLRVYWGREGSVPTLAKVQTTNLMFV